MAERSIICPSCAKKGISFWQKAFPGSGLARITCGFCGARFRPHAAWRAAGMRAAMFYSIAGIIVPALSFAALYALFPDPFIDVIGALVMMIAWPIVRIGMINYYAPLIEIPKEGEAARSPLAAGNILDPNAKVRVFSDRTIFFLTFFAIVAVLLWLMFRPLQIHPPL
jgi:hypothetical protein